MASRAALIWFFVLAYALSWAWAVPLALLGEVVRRGHGWPASFPALFGPMVAAFIVTGVVFGRGGIGDLWQRMIRWRVPLRWWLVALSPVAFLAVALVGLRVLGHQWPSLSEFGRFTGLPMLGVVAVWVAITLEAFGEETGWRGFALPQLQLRTSALRATLCLAPLWALWHLPQFFIIATYRDLGPGDFIGFLLGLTSGAIVLTWLYNRSGSSILMVALWHGTYNLVGATAAAVGTIAAVISTLIMVQAVVLVAAELRATRRGHPSIIGPR
jgi:membrane protease YdiL (CAAX protease family)